MRTCCTMAMHKSALLGLLELLTAAEADDRVALGLRRLYQELVEAEASVKICSDHWERTDDQVAVRKGLTRISLTRWPAPGIVTLFLLSSGGFQRVHYLLELDGPGCGGGHEPVRGPRST